MIGQGPGTKAIAPARVVVGPALANKPKSGGINISHNPYESMGLAKNEKGQIVRNPNVDINRNHFFNYGDEQEEDRQENNAN